MKTSKKTIVLNMVELSEIDLDVAIENYPEVERQVLAYIKTRDPNINLPPARDVSISMTVEFKTEGIFQDKKSPHPNEFLKPPTQDNTLVGPIDIPESQAPNTETKDVIMEPGALMGNLIKNSKPADDEED